ncbi:molybdate ABC transporter substrate-binding protein [Rathayibacter sp. AY1C9]|uniref:molybdate ABC transporter substrate-binding protein n=1 Tax=Rathayibacter sp. AY1C9 TaxID=2080541 RepID=UPI000CE92CD1|nr:molybdate ABC transporter substrate-binding protein [Rathayibacter sp. AY1C9]PPH44497.1 molybdate ABC transporter substrate-binding protein [Rathayibacter sp. AY1C9]
MHRRLLPLVPAAAALLLLAGCSAPSTPAGDTATGGATSSVGGSITVFAAASLKGAFTELATGFEAAEPGAQVELSFAGSSDLATQIVNGAPADVFASADERTMSTVAEAGFVDGDPVDIATNTLEIAVPPGNPAQVASLADLARPGTATVVCAPQVPCGAAAVAVEQAAGVDISPVSEESSVTDVLGKVSSGEADAGLVYATDVRGAAGSVTGIPFDEASEAVNTYPIAALTGAGDPATAAAFVAYVASDAGRAVLAAAGFGAP